LIEFLLFSLLKSWDGSMALIMTNLKLFYSSCEPTLAVWGCSYPNLAGCVDECISVGGRVYKSR